MYLALAGDVAGGQAHLEALREELRGREKLPGQPRIRDAFKLVKELGDVLWYFALMLDTNGITFNEVMEANVFKLCGRYPARHGKPEDIIAEKAV